MRQKKFQAKHGATKLLFSILRVMCAVILVKAFLLMAVFWLIALEIEKENVDGPAPDGDYRVRREWGEQNLEVYLTSAENWIKRSAEINKDVGQVYGIAPIRGPNNHGTSFGESWTNLNLQILGTKGEGILRVKEYNWGGRSGQAVWQKRHWSFKSFQVSENVR